MKKFCIILSTVFFVMVLSAENLYLDEPVYQGGEKATYGVYFNLGFLWMHAGEVTFETEDAKYEGRDCYKMTVIGRTYGAFERFYTIRDTFISYIDKNTRRPVYYYDGKHEDSYYSSTQYWYTDVGDSTHVRYYRIKKKNTWNLEFNIPKDANDMIACCYNVRCLDINSMIRGQVSDFYMMHEDSVYTLGLKFQGKETVKVKNGTRYKSCVFTPKVISGDLFKKEDDLKVYVADDDNHVPVYVEAKLKMGHAIASLEKIEGTKHKIEAIKPK